jgi:hypothetical protein
LAERLTPMKNWSRCLSSPYIAGTPLFCVLFLFLPWPPLTWRSPLWFLCPPPENRVTLPAPQRTRPGADRVGRLQSGDRPIRLDPGCSRERVTVARTTAGPSPLCAEGMRAASSSFRPSRDVGRASCRNLGDRRRGVGALRSLLGCPTHVLHHLTELCERELAFVTAGVGAVADGVAAVLVAGEQPAEPFVELPAVVFRFGDL